MPRGIYPHRKGIIKGIYKKIPLLFRFLEKIDPLVTGNECWFWKGYKNPKGYGTINPGSKKESDIPSHRASYLLFRGKIEDGLLVLHKCDNPSCVNPNHLFLGTAKDNTQDMVNKGRHFWKIPKTHCPRGHLYTITGKNKNCKTCKKIKYQLKKGQLCPTN